MTSIKIGQNGLLWKQNTLLNKSFENCNNSIKIQNGWNPQNLPHIISGGSSTLLRTTTTKMAMKYVAPTTKNMTELWVLPCCYFDSASNASIYWKASIQQDNNGNPDGTIIGYGIANNMTDEVWMKFLLSPIQLIKGTVYWIVLQYDSGPAPTVGSGGYYPGVYASSFATSEITETPLPYNYCGGDDDNSINDEGTTTVRYFNGTVWQNDTNNRTLPVFAVRYDDNTWHGQPYRHNYLGVPDTSGGYTKSGFFFINKSSDKTVDALRCPWNSSSTTRPVDNLYYYIHENDWNGTILSSGIFLTPNELVITNGGPGDRRWYTKTFSNPITFKKNQKYFVYFDSPLTTSSFWQTDSPYTYLGAQTGDALTLVTETSYQKEQSYMVKTRSNWASNIVNYYGNDWSFRFHLADTYVGEIISNQVDAEVYGNIGKVWRYIKFDGLIPAGTSVSIEVTSSICGGYTAVVTNAAPNIEYLLPSCAQTRFASFKLVLTTTDTTISPIIYNMSLINNECPTPQITITITEVI